MDDRRRIDPEGKYPASEPTAAEEGALRILRLLRYRPARIYAFLSEQTGALSDNPEHAEEELLRLRDLLRTPKVERTRDAIQIDYLDQHGLVLLVTPEALEIRLPTVEWSGPHRPAPSSRFWTRVSWKELGDLEADDAPLLDLILAALEARAAEFRRCRYCKRSVPAEHRHSHDVCRSCASQRPGIAH